MAQKPTFTKTAPKKPVIAIDPDQVKLGKALQKVTETLESNHKKVKGLDGMIRDRTKRLREDVLAVKRNARETQTKVTKLETALNKALARIDELEKQAKSFKSKTSKTVGDK